MLVLRPMGQPGVAPAYVRAWSQEEEALLVRLYETMTAEAIVPHLPGRTFDAITTHLYVMRNKGGLVSVQPKGKCVSYSPQEDRFIRQHCADKPIQWMADQLGRSYASVRGRGIRLGLSFRKLGDTHHSTRHSDAVVHQVRELRDDEERPLTFREIGARLGISWRSAQKLYYVRQTADDRYWQDLLP